MPHPFTRGTCHSQGVYATLILKGYMPHPFKWGSCHTHLQRVNSGTATINNIANKVEVTSCHEGCISYSNVMPHPITGDMSHLSM